jgi:amino-acid N-acetyltransferase
MLRQARVADVPAIHQMISRFADKGRMLPRPRARIYETLRDFLVEEDADAVVGTGALRILWADLGEICSLAVEESHQGAGVGRRIVENLISQAILLGLKRVLVLTYIPAFFHKFGFHEVEKSELPHKVWMGCVNCPKFPDCGELALVKDIE